MDRIDFWKAQLALIKRLCLHQDKVFITTGSKQALMQSRTHRFFIRNIATNYLHYPRDAIKQREPLICVTNENRYNRKWDGR